MFLKTPYKQKKTRSTFRMSLKTFLFRNQIYIPDGTTCVVLIMQFSICLLYHILPIYCNGYFAQSFSTELPCLLPTGSGNKWGLRSQMPFVHGILYASVSVTFRNVTVISFFLPTVMYSTMLLRVRCQIS